MRSRTATSFSECAAGATWLTRFIVIVAAAFLAAFAVPTAALAQKSDSKPTGSVVLELKGGEKSDDIARMVDTLGKGGKSVTVRFADPSSAAEAAPPSAAASPTSPPDAAAGAGAFVTHLVDSLRVTIPGLRAIPTLAADFANDVTGESAGSAISAWLSLLAALAVALALGWIVYRALARALALHAQHCTASTSSRMAISLRRLAVDVVAAGAAMIAFKLLSDWWTPQTPLATAAAQALLQVLGAFTIYVTIGRFLLSPDDRASRLLQLPHAEFHFRMLLIYVAVGQATFTLLSLADAAASNRNAVAGLFFIVSIAITAFKLWWFWFARHDIEALILDAGPDRDSPSLARRIIAASTPWIYMAASVAIWLIARVAVMMPDGAQWAWAAGASQFVIVLLPIAAVGAVHLLRDLHHRPAEDISPSPLRNAAGAVGERAVGGVIWLGGLFILARMWGDFFMESGSQMIVQQIRNLFTVVAVLIVGYLILVFLKTLFDAHAPKKLSTVPGDEDNAHDQVQTRIGSVLPILRGFSLGAIIGLTALVALSKLGVDIGPLLAGFGILGLAISFGSQALVRDIVSGLFFMVEDAFRVGEYIDTGRLRGTVEKISLRSIQLRHQSGQIHTIPFGQIASVTNASRDWATVKFNIKLDRATDIEKARKAIKKTGLAMLEDPEIGKDFILPLKMQGVSDIIETGIIVRLKFTAKPTSSSQLQRESLRRVHRALNEAGVSFASNAVIVNRSGDDLAAAAASVNIAQRAANAPAA